MQQNDQQKTKIILNAARELFFQFGFSKTCMDDIAAQSGLAKPTLYYYYDNKEAIFNEIVMEEANNFIESLDKAIAEEGTVEQKVTRFYQTIYDNLKKYAAELARLPEALSTHSPHGKPVINRIREMMMGRLEMLLEYGMNEGVFEIKDKEAYKNAISFMTGFLNHEWMRSYPPEMRENVVNTMITILINGLKRRPV
jgi:AcrR family transcriptional regulator